MKVLVTGGGGFLGTYIVKELISRDHEVVNLSRSRYPHLDDLGINTIQCDLTNKDSVDELDLSSFDAVIHSAALAGVWGDAKKYYQINFEGTSHLLAKIKSANIKFLVYTSSPSVVFGADDIVDGNEDLNYPEKFYTHYARTKSMAEKLVLESNSDTLKCLSLRPHLIWGPGDPHLIPRVLKKAKAGKLKVVGDGSNMVDIIYVENAAVAHVDALEALGNGKEIGGNAYFIGQERPVNLWHFLNEILRLNKIEPIHDRISFNMAFRIGAVLEMVFKFLGILSPEPPMTRFVALQLAKNHYFSHDKAKNDFGYDPKISIEQGLEATFINRPL